MNLNKISRSKFHKLVVKLIAFAVLANGLLVIVGTLIRLFATKDSGQFNLFSIEVSLLIGLTLVYLANLLWRQKHTAWLVALLVYAFYIGITLNEVIISEDHGKINTLLLTRNIIIPFLVIIGLIYARNTYKVKSDIRSFGVSLRITLIVLLIAFCYGIAGFQLIDKSDFHQEISLSEAAHRTIDQFGFTTKDQLVPYTKRARLFLDSLNVISAAAVAYALLSLFQPLRARLGDQSANRELVKKLLEEHNASSEDFFKLWPYDKSYFFNDGKTAGVAFKVSRGIALVVGDPFGGVTEFSKLLDEFSEFCRINDWKISYIHTESHYSPLYIKKGFNIQKIGEEAIINIDHYLTGVIDNKYFRNIINRFEKQNYSYEMLYPPHDQAIIKRIKEVSDDWLKIPGKVERGFMMGFLNEPYLQECNILVLRDSASTIQAFINQIPSFDSEEANYDLIRHTQNSLSNSTDYLLINFIHMASNQGLKRVNLGLSPLVGFDKNDKNKSLIDSAMKFVYANGDRFYSFSGLHRFKAKYEPSWSDRYIVYKGGIRSFIRTLNALNIAMKPHRYHIDKNLVDRSKKITTE